MKAFLYTLAIVLIAGLAASTAYASDKETYFEVARDDVATAVSKALAERGAADKVRTVVYSADPVLYRANAPLNVAIEALSFDKAAHKWQANMHILSKNETVSVSPIQGRYEEVYSVPVLTRQTASTDIITDADLTMMDVPARQIRKDTVINMSDILGKSPKRGISPNRPIRLAEINLPTIVKKGSSVSIHYSAPYMNLRTAGVALEDGSLGSMIRVKNQESDRAISARVTSAGIVETNPQKTVTALN